MREIDKHTHINREIERGDRQTDRQRQRDTERQADTDKDAFLNGHFTA